MPSDNESRYEAPRLGWADLWPEARLADVIARAERSPSPFPAADDRAAWRALHGKHGYAERSTWLIKEAVRLANSQPARVLLSDILDYLRDDDRGRFDPVFHRPSRELGVLTLAECIEGEGRFLSAAADRIWALCEATSWAHPPTGLYQFSDTIPEPRPPVAELPITGVEDMPFPDLFACETAHAVMEACHLLGPGLDQLSLSIRRRAVQTCERLVLRPVLERSLLNWMAGRNNWTAWCSDSTLQAAALAWSDPARLAALARRLLLACDRLLARLGEDGGCDEGPAYWAQSSARLFGFANTLHRLTGGACDPLAEVPRFRALGGYLTAVHLAGPWFANFADAGARSQLKRGLTAGFGRFIGDHGLENLGALAAVDFVPDGPLASPFLESVNSGWLQQALRDLHWLPATPPPCAVHALDRWLPDLQVAVFREKTADTQGFVVAAKGGHNDENHNHNDVGHAIVLHDGRPLLIDLGPETYREYTFGPERYTRCWTVRGSAHNAPIVLGCEQTAGRHYAARATHFASFPTGNVFSLDLAPAYPAEAELQSCLRTIRMEREPVATVRIEDSLLGRLPSMTAEWIFFTPARPEIQGPTLLWPGARSVRMKVDGPIRDLLIEAVPLSDAWLQKNWGEAVWKIRVLAAASAPSLHVAFTLSVQE